MPKIYQNVGVPAAPVFNFSANGPATIPGNLRQKYDSYIRALLSSPAVINDLPSGLKITM